MLVLLAVLVAVASGRNMCFFSIGHTHITVVDSVITEAARHHNVTVFVPSSQADHARRILPGVRVEVGHLQPPDAMPDAMQPLMWMIPRSFGLGLLSPMLGIIRGFMERATPDVRERNLRGCEVAVVDPFLATYGDSAAALGVPAVFLLNYYDWFVPPEGLLPLLQPATLEPHGSYARLVHAAVNLAMRALFTTFSLINGVVLYGHPRPMMSAVFARPLLVTGGPAEQLSPAPRSVIMLGSKRIQVPATPVVWPASCPGHSNATLIYAAFGTLVKLPKFAFERVCSALRRALDAGVADVALFAVTPLDFDASSCSRDPRVCVVARAAQAPVLFSGQVNVFLTHGGYSSLVEGLSSRTPFVVLPVMPNDQPYHSDLVAAARFGLPSSTGDTAEQIGDKIIAVARNRAAHVEAITRADARDQLRQRVSMEQLAVSLLDAVAAEGADNALQRLVSHDWMPFAKPGGTHYLASPAVLCGSTLWLAAALFVFVRCIALCIRCCRCCCCRGGGRKIKSE